MHAVLARRHGYAVTQLEREQAGRGASVRNFGLVWVSGRRAGPELALALRARELWAEIAEGAPGTGFRPRSLTIATGEAELAVMREAAAPAGRQAARIRAARRRRGAIGQPGPARRVPGRPALPGRRDRRAPGRAAGAARARWRGPLRVATRARGRRDRAARRARPHGDWHRGDLVVLCTGANSPAWPGRTWPRRRARQRIPATGEAEPTGLRRVRLQMLQTLPFDGTLTTSLADGDSLRYYPAYDVPSRAALAAAAGGRGRQPVTAAAGAAAGRVADHRRHPRVRRAVRVRRRRDRLRPPARPRHALLGVPLPRVQRRWAGVYSEVVGTPRSTTGPRSRPAWSWSPDPAGAA